MSAAELGPDVIETLRSIDLSGHLGILLGAGASVAAGLPDWNRLAVDLLVASKAIDDEETARAFLASQDPALAAEAAKVAAGSDWVAILRDALYASVPATRPAPLHTSAALLVQDKNPDSFRLFTLNYDDLLESALREVLDEIDRNFGVFTRATDAPRAKPGQYEIHHLHGFFGPNSTDANSVILTLSDYNKLGQVSRPWQVSALQDCIQRGPLILAGTSYRDPDIRQWIHDLTHGGRGSNILVFLARQGLRLGRDQFSKVSAALAAQWSALGVQVVTTHDHNDAAQALRELRMVGDPGYLPPSQRLATLWEAHVENFGRLQDDQSAELAEDLATLREQFSNVGNLTLWIVDSSGQLVRWAANDRSYRDPVELRRIAPGHDSDWIAGECLGRNETLIRDVPDRAATERWQAVAATPLVAKIPGGPEIPCGVISAGLTDSFGEDDADEVDEVFAELSAKWSARAEAAL